MGRGFIRVVTETKIGSYHRGHYISKSIAFSRQKSLLGEIKTVPLPRYRLHRKVDLHGDQDIEHSNPCRKRQKLEKRLNEALTFTATRLRFSTIQGLVSSALPCLAALLVCCSPVCNALALAPELSTTDISKEQYERAIKAHSSRSNLPSKGEAEMLLQLDQDLFTDDAWEGMKT